MTAQEIRQRFLSYFQARGHQVVPSSSLVPADDPTLLFTNAGMNQFKDVFLGREVRSYRRAVSVQKCVRAGGKHNDLDTVGRTARHGTFFEMLGNWSFGDYFKREAIEYAWDFVINVLGLPADKIWVTVFRDDDEAYGLWQEVAGVPPERIVRLGEKDNFWEMAETGPCGPDTELFIDRGEELSCGPDCGIGRCECGRYVEFWNLVFIQYDRGPDGRLTPLPAPCVDTGMGLERITSIVEGVPSNWDTELLYPLIAQVEQLSGRPYDPGEAGLPFRVIADHVRSVTMLLSDGVLFSNEGRGYVMRRILRRAVRYGRVIGLEEPFLWKMVPTVGDIMGSAYPEVLEGQSTIQATIRGEEERFHLTLEAGLKLLGEMLDRLPPGGTLAGRDAFQLYDTYGFPLDLAVDAAGERGMTVDAEGFDEAMAEQRERARRDRPARVRDLPVMPPSTFVGYSQLEAETVVDLMLLDGEPVDQVVEGDEVIVYLGVTPFYPEGGGQVGDQGQLRGPYGILVVDDTQKQNGAIWHWARVASGRVQRGDSVTASVNAELRAGAMRNHTGTHLLHAALREVLGTGARQTGSLVAPDRLRFDFSHPEPMTPAQIRAVEDLVNRWILEDRAVTTTETSLAEAREGGAIAFFGEKYGETVRVVEVPGASKELCGGTHCRRTGQIGSLRIVEETGIGSGMRRIEALTGWGVLNWSRQQEALVQEAAGLLKRPARELVARVAEMLEENRALERQQAQWAAARTAETARTLVGSVDVSEGLRVLVAEVSAAGSDTLRELADLVREQVDVAVLAARDQERAWLLALAGPEAQRRGIQAGRLVRELAPAVGGGGGGRPDLAQAGGKRPEGVSEVVRLAKPLIQAMARQDITQSGAK
jgi:alanyl-tRNA synthetase